MKKLLPIFLIFFSFYFIHAQNIEIKDEIAYVDGKPYLKIERKNKFRFLLYDVKTNEKLLKIRVKSKNNSINQFLYYFSQFHFFKINKDLIFNEKVFESEYGLIKFLYQHNVFVSDKEITTKRVLEDYKRLSTKASCQKIIKNGFSQIIYDQFASVINNDTLFVNEIKYRCVHSALYTKKVMYDRFGMWDKAVITERGKRYPNLIWKDIKLFTDLDKKFTVIARGVESRQTIYASIMVFDEEGNDMLTKDSAFQFRLVEFFGYLIKQNSNNRDFYDVYWKKIDENQWNEIQEHKKKRKIKPIKTAQDL